MTNTTISALKIENPINMLEFTSVLSKLRGKTPGMDRVSYPMLKNLPLNMNHRLLKLYNKIFSSYNYPSKV